MVWTRKKAFKDASLNILFQYSVLFLVLIRGFLFSKYLGPEGYGLWASIYLIYTYGQYSHFGLFTGISFLVPEYLNNGKEKEVTNWLSTAITFANSFGIITFVFLVFFSFSGLSDFFSNNFFIITIVSLSIILFLNFNFFTLRFQFTHKFTTAGKYQFLLTLSDLVLSFVLLKIFGLSGAFLGMAISLLFFVIIMSKEGFNDLFISFDKNIFKKITSIGFKLLIIYFCFALFTTADKLSVANYYTKTEMGFFSNAVAFAMLPYTIALAINGLVSQRMIELYGKNKSAKEIKIFLDENIFAVAFLIPFFSVLLVAFAEPAIIFLLPKYINSLRFVDKLSVGVYFLAIGLVCYSYMLVRKNYRFVLILIIALIVIVLLANYFLSHFGKDIIWVTYVSVIGYFIFATSLYFFIYHEFYNFTRIVWMYIRLALPVIPILFAFSLKFIIDDNVLRFIIRIVIAILWGVFAYFYLKKKTIILSQITDIIKEKIPF